MRSASEGGRWIHLNGLVSVVEEWCGVDCTASSREIKMKRQRAVSDGDLISGVEISEANPTSEPWRPMTSARRERGDRPGARDARSLQTTLAKHWGSDDGADRWSARRTLVFVVVASSLLWGAIGILITQLF